MTDTDKRIKMAAKKAVYHRNYRRARDRALTQLAQAHPEEYKSLLEREKALDEQMGKKWLDINGATIASQLGIRPPTTDKYGNPTYNDGENTVYDGGEA